MTLLNTEAKQTETINTTPTNESVLVKTPDLNLTQKNLENPDQNNAETKQQESPEDPNWKAFREARKRDRMEREAAERRAAEKEAEVAALKAAMDAAFSKGSPSPQAYQQYYGMNQDYQTEETEEQRIERKVSEMLSKKEEQYRKEQAEYEQREYPKRLLRELPDFQQICSQENLDYLDYHYPEVSRPLQRLGEGYDKWYDTYHAVKKLIPNHSNAKKEAARADLNSNKPKSMSSTGPSPTGEKTRESWQDLEAKRAENWARMQRMMKGV